MNWVLYGFKGVGKTYFGKKLGLPFIDTDELIEEKCKLSPKEIALQKGESHFRALEKDAILSLDVSDTVIAVGGGAVLDPENVKVLRSLGKLIYLKQSKETILDFPLPSFLDNFEKMNAQRKPIYEAIADITIDLEGKKEDQILGELWQAIGLDKSLRLPPGENPTAKQ